MAHLCGGVALLLSTICLETQAQPGQSDQAAQGRVWLDTLDLTTYQQRRGRPKSRLSLSEKPLTLGGVRYERGVGSRSIAEYILDLGGQGLRFHAVVGLDDFAVDNQKEGSVRFQLWADERLVADSDVIRVGGSPKLLDVDVRGARTLTLRIDDGGDTSNGDIADWADAYIDMVPGAPSPVPYAMPPARPRTVAMPDETHTQLTGARVVGSTPGKPFLHRIGATGPGPIRFSARGLPRGLSLNPTTGVITGTMATAGETDVTVTAKGPGGTATRKLRIIGGTGVLAQTPPMGWNSWNVWGTDVDDAKVRAAADALVASGLANHGYDYVVLDDAWTNGRHPDGRFKPTERFPDMKGLADYIHSKGLKFGIYSSPGPKTCGQYEGSWQHEELDAATFAEWGVDFLKYDWCSYDDVVDDRSLETLQKPYSLMGSALAAQPRDIIFSLCQYGYGDVWKWGGDVGGHLWRTTGDLLDSWSNLDSVGFRHAGRESYVTRGRWNDTDMLVLGTLGWGDNLHPTRLTPDEQILHMTLWAMQAAPLFIGADLTKLDDFTRALLTNDEMLDINSDPAAKAGGRLWARDRLEVWTRPLADGTMAVALFNRGLTDRPVRVDWQAMGLSGAQPIRDIWQKRDLGQFADGYEAQVPSHGAMLLKVGKPTVKAIASK